MAGEKIVVVDDSAAVQEIVKTVLTEEGYKVTVASNGMAALTYPQLQDVDLLIIDSEMEGIDGFEATKVIKTDAETHTIPILLLIPEEQAETRAAQSLRGANNYLLKPFEPKALALKVHALLEEQRIYEKSRKFLEEAADKFMEKIAEDHIQAAVEKKTQIIVERAIQNVITMIDQRARKEADAKVTSLTAEKEQELVKATVHEVARSMVEKLAERKVGEAVDAVLNEQTERAVKRVAEHMLPSLVRDRIKESMEHTLPREVQMRVQKAAEQLVPEVSNKIVTMIDGIAQKVIPRVAKDRIPELIEKNIAAVTSKSVPRLVQDLTRREIDDQFQARINPTINEAVRRIRARVNVINLVILVVVFLGIVGNLYLSWISHGKLLP